MPTYIPRLNGVVLPGNEYPKLASFTAPSLPFSESLVALHSFGLSLDSSRVNYIAGHPELGVVGAPMVDPLGARLNRANHFLTDFVPTASYSVLVIAKPLKVPSSSQNYGFILGNYRDAGGGVFAGDNLLFADLGAGPSFMNFVQGTAGGGMGTRGSINISGLDETKWHAFLSVLGPGGSGALERSNVAVGRGGILTWGTDAIGAHTPNQPGPMHIGGFDVWAGTSIGSTQTVTEQMVAIYNRRLSTAECETVYQYLHESWAPAAGFDGL